MLRQRSQRQPGVSFFQRDEDYSGARGPIIATQEAITGGAIKMLAFGSNSEQFYRGFHSFA
ncbi:hypothetical protein HYN49_09825 [Flavobacterium pallidum]|uniref:Uncharacterized protein n=1 Tax=Flavobacterium pallidum TaxID=2172098 RepID=A0A2S1SIK4_9FLAO|nr:hypothetical protein HYN49_09825 [Flavobacterium pallidum]